MNTHSDVSDRPPDSPNNSSESQPKACPGRNDSFGGGRSLRNLWTSGLRQRQLGDWPHFVAYTARLHRSSKGARVSFEGKKRTVTDGPFAETKELVVGFWLWNCASLQEATEWAKRCPNPMRDGSEIEIRRVFEAEDFGPARTPELREQEERLRAELEQRKGS